MSEQTVATLHDSRVPGNAVVKDGNPNPLTFSSNSSSSDTSIGTLGPGQISVLPPGETMPTYSPPTNYGAPWLNIIWPSVPDVLPVAPGSTGSGGGAPGLYANIVVPFASMRTAEQSFLNQLSTMVSQYDSLADATMNAITSPSFFGQQAQAVIYWELPNDFGAGQQKYNYSVPANLPAGDPPASGTYIVSDARVQYAAEQFAYGTNGTNGFVSSAENTLNAVAGSVETAGQLLAAVAKAMDAYAYADVHSAAPPLTAIPAIPKG